MLVLDTDHLTEFQKGTSAEATRLRTRLVQAAEPYATAILSVEEIMRGWMAAVRRTSDPHGQINVYFKLQQLFRFFATWHILAWNESAADEFCRLKQAKIRVGTMDLMIASICLANGATLLSRNAADFSRIPGLQVEDWLQ